MASEKVLKIVEDVKELSVLELNDLVKALEEEFGVSAAAMVAAGPAAGAAAAAEEKTEITTEARKYGVLEMQENIPEPPFTDAAKSLGKALLSGDFSVFESLLDDNSEHISYKKETISGKSQIVEYWKG